MRRKIINDYRLFTPSYCKDIGISKFGFVAKTQFLLHLETTQR